MEAFSVLVNKAVVEGLQSSYKFVHISGEEMQISHLLFTDHTLVFCKDFRDQLANLSMLLLWFEGISGLNINLEKSFLIPVGVA